LSLIAYSLLKKNGKSLYIFNLFSNCPSHFFIPIL
jgi:hypothetical protein